MKAFLSTALDYLTLALLILALLILTTPPEPR